VKAVERTSSSKRRFSAAAALAAVASALGGCRSCANDHPYVPPAVEFATTTAADAAAAAVPTFTRPDGGARVEAAVAPPPDATSVPLDGASLEAGGREIALVLARDFDDDGKKDAIAIVRPVARERRPGSPAGEVVYFHGSDTRAEGRPLATSIPGPAVALQGGCAPTARLEAIGPRAAFVEIGMVCPRGTASRAIVVLRLPRSGGAAIPEVAFDAVVVDPPFAPKLAVDAESVDRDKDGLDDVVVALTIEGEKGAATATAKLAFFDRPAGPSRDPEEPEASLHTLAASAAARAGKAKDASGAAVALGLVAQVRALYRAACLEGGAPRLTQIHGGAAASCGSSKALEEASVAEVRAFAARGDALRAFAAAADAQQAPATKTAARSAELQKALVEVAPVVQASSVRVLGAAVDRAGETQPAWGPLAFEPSGKVLVRHGASVVRADVQTGDEATVDVPAWKSDVLSPDGKSRWIEAYHACEGVALHATFAPTGDGDIVDVLLPVEPRLGKSCSGARGDPAATVPISWGPRGLEALVAGQPVLLKLDPPGATSLPGLLDEPAPQGSPRSASRKSFALAVATGVLLRGRNAEKWALVRARELEPYAQLRHCVASDDATKIACEQKEVALAASLPAP
jgi:hypothetical protein